MTISRSTWTALGLLLLAHVILASVFASITPYRQSGLVTLNRSVEKDIGAPDERQHANYVARLLNGEGFPVFNPKDPNLYETYQAHQPPLFYIVAAGFAKVTGVNDPTDAETGGRLRFLNVILGAIVVAGVFFLGKNLQLPEPAIIAATAFAALLPMNLALSGALSNDPLLFALCTWTLVGLAHGSRNGWNIKRAVTVGVLIGLACLTKTTALALLPVAFLALVLPGEHRPGIREAGIALVLPILIAGGWWLRNLNLYGDPFAIRAFSEAFQGSAQKEMFVTQIIPSQSPEANPELEYWTRWVGWWTVRSFYGVFGYMDIWMTQSGRQSPDFEQNRLYWVLILVGTVGLAGGLFQAARDKENRKPSVFLVAFAALIGLLFLRFNNQYFQAQARYLLPALAPIAIWIGSGYSAIMKSRANLAVVVVAVPLLLANAFAISRLPGEFSARIEAGRVPESQQP